MPSHILVVQRRQDADWIEGDHKVLTAREYIAGTAELKPKAKVINLARSYDYLGYGYYCSLLAEARRHRVLPSVKTILELGRRTLYRAELAEIEERLRRSLKRMAVPPEGAFSVLVVLGLADDRRFLDLGRRVFDRFGCPLLKVEIRWRGDWTIHAVRPLGIDDLRDEQQPHFNAALAAYTRAGWHRPRIDRPSKYAIALLHNPRDPYQASDQKALERFVRAGEAMDLEVELIQKRDFPRLGEFDALLIRETTAIESHTYRFAQRAEHDGIPVIDDPTSILRCANKVYLAELLRANGVASPRTVVFDRSNPLVAEQHLSYPMVIKVPDGSFSRGVFKVADRAELTKRTQGLFEDSDLLLAQEFMPTEFDWRVGVLNGRALFVCQYHMARAHWQIYNHNAREGRKTGAFKNLPIERAPQQVVETAVRAATLIGDGLYGVDLKQTASGVFVLEINDNPNIDAGIEDQVLKDELYRIILKDLVRRIEKRLAA